MAKVSSDRVNAEVLTEDKYVENFGEAFKTGVQISASPPKKRGVCKALLFLIFDIKLNILGFT